MLFEQPAPLKELPAGLDDLLWRMLAKDPALRPADGAALAAELRALGPAFAGTREPVARDVGALDSTATASWLPANLTLLRSAGAAGLAAAERQLASVIYVASGASGDVAAIRQAAEPLGARIEPLADGSIVLAAAALPAARVALATGWALMGEPWPLGEAVDRAVAMACLRSASQAGVRLDETTAGLIGGRYELWADEAGLLLGAERALEEEEPRLLLGKPTPCVGREAELALLRSAFEQCAAEPELRALLVTGPAGIGKSRLRHELVRGLRGRAEIWIGRGDPVAAGAPFGMIAPALRRSAGILDGEPVQARRRKLSARVARHVPEAECDRVAEFLGEMIGTPWPDETSARLRAARADPALMGDQMNRAWQDLVLAELAAGPLVIVLDDLHWGDVPTVAYLDHTMKLCARLPLFVLGLARPEIHEIIPRLWAGRAVQHVPLGELRPASGERLVRVVLGEKLPAETVAQLVEQAAGNAFFLEELIRAVAQGRAGSLPETVVAMARARLDGLEPEARRVLRAASVLGMSFWPGAVTALLGADPAGAQVRCWLDQLAADELVTPWRESRFAHERQYGFRHAFVRDCAYAMLTEADRAFLHGRAGDWLERAGETDAMVLAEHYERGGERERAAQWFLDAAAQALDGGDFVAAIGRAERGVACGAKGQQLGELRLVQAEAYKWRGEARQASSCAQEARLLLPRGSKSWAGAVVQLALAAQKLAEHETALDLVLELGELLRARATASPVVSAAVMVARTLLLLGRADVAGPLLGLAERHVTPSVGEDARGWLLRAQAARALCSGELYADLGLKAAAAACFEAIGDRRNVLWCRAGQANSLMQLGRYAEAEVLMRECWREAEQIGLSFVVTLNRANLGFVLARLGALDEAHEIEAAVLDIARQQGDRTTASYARVYLAEIHLRAGRLEAAEAEARAASEAGDIMAQALLASVLLAQGRSAEALASARQAKQGLDSCGGIQEGEALVRLVWAEALDATGDREAARAAIAAAHERLLERASRIDDEELRASFLERVPENARTMELAQRWCAGK
ncbi:MAG: AAA family ATPase [Deltaproteobacteria bacterium]|nr:AAA family ATPase [Deltaproteobacteria bacterium]